MVCISIPDQDDCHARPYEERRGVTTSGISGLHSWHWWALSYFSGILGAPCTNFLSAADTWQCSRINKEHVSQPSLSLDTSTCRSGHQWPGDLCLWHSQCRVGLESYRVLKQSMGSELLFFHHPWSFLPSTRARLCIDEKTIHQSAMRLRRERSLQRKTQCPSFHPERRCKPWEIFSAQLEKFEMATDVNALLVAQTLSTPSRQVALANPSCYRTWKISLTSRREYFPNDNFLRHTKIQSYL